MSLRPKLSALLSLGGIAAASASQVVSMTVPGTVTSGVNYGWALMLLGVGGLGMARPGRRDRRSPVL